MVPEKVDVSAGKTKWAWVRREKLKMAHPEKGPHVWKLRRPMRVNAGEYIAVHGRNVDGNGLKVRSLGQSNGGGGVLRVGGGGGGGGGRESKEGGRERERESLKGSFQRATVPPLLFRTISLAHSVSQTVLHPKATQIFYASYGGNSGDKFCGSDDNSKKSQYFELNRWTGSLRMGFKIRPDGQGRTLRKLSDKAVAMDERLRLEAFEKLVQAYNMRYVELMKVGAGKSAGRGPINKVSVEVRGRSFVLLQFADRVQLTKIFSFGRFV